MELQARVHQEPEPVLPLTQRLSTRPQVSHAGLKRITRCTQRPPQARASVGTLSLQRASHSLAKRERFARAYILTAALNAAYARRSLVDRRHNNAAQSPHLCRPPRRRPRLRGAGRNECLGAGEEGGRGEGFELHGCLRTVRRERCSLSRGARVVGVPRRLCECCALLCSAYRVRSTMNRRAWAAFNAPVRLWVRKTRAFRWEMLCML